MTNSEAIEVIKQYRGLFPSANNEDVSLDVAINALEENQKISREKDKKKMENKMEFLAKLDAWCLKEELLAFLDCEDIEVDSIEDFQEKFVDYIEEDFSRGDC